ncbi:MAG: DUF192 domain-containing protein [Salinirussus sp.]
MRLRHVPRGQEADEGRILANQVEVADTVLAKLRGLAFRDVPDDFALVFEFGSPGYRSIHMLFVRESLDVIWLYDGAVRKRQTLAPWTGFGIARADRVIELPAGAATGVDPGDEVRIEMD